ncbi:RNA polymerase sigma factor RpoE [Sedimentisphaera cyanobacteriorum]|uniref:RNA polymerase sigma factor RpoE n=1 Tax=Sedimentisphaera cyanobacteriorum TaxID=1940790 RepID=A0A1Q2HMS2_9BACT|nr:sigma-70 family RNA polymerase sigma factor [Sedimentisphaera cyanobacteriorum]AQQ08660.1 RNA polymerase sigma factor RpoE [Sedimentisphaera cyanobacteriorum]
MKAEIQKNTDMHTGEKFTDLLTGNQRQIHAYIISLVGNFNDSEDILQETTKEMWQKFEDYKLGTNFLAWGKKIAYYKVLEYRNRNKRKKFVFDDYILQQISRESASELKDTNAYTMFLEDCIKKLRESDLSLVKSLYVEQKTVKQLCASLNRSHQSIYRSLGRILNLLRQCIIRASMRAGNE